MPADKDTLETIARRIVPDAAVVNHLGTGGFACTFKVTGDGDPYALKLIDPGLSEAARVERELSALRRVQHPGVVRFIDHGDFEHEGIVYKWIKMSFVEGHSLRQAIGGGQVFDAIDALQLVRALVDAASAIWEQRTAHRDLSPGNILLKPDNTPVIVDLGLARHVDDETLTELPTPGTPGWMSPEQVKTSPTHGDWRSDQFVIGALGYLFLTGVVPFAAPSVRDRWFAPAHQVPTPIRAVDSNIPSVAADVVERMLQKQPHRRYLRAADIIADLDRAILALHDSQVGEAAPQEFFVNIAQVKNFAEGAGMASIAPHGVIVDIRAGKRVAEFVDAARAIGARSVVDPVTHFARSPEEWRPAQVKKLPYGADPRLTGFSDDAARTAFCRSVLELQMESSPDVVIAPYFYAGEGEASWITESLECAAKFEELMEERAPGERAEVWTGVAVHSSWLADETARDVLLSDITGQPMAALYLLVATSQPSFAPLGDLPTLRGFRDLLTVLREAAVPVIAGKRASSGLLLLALGAAGWGTGVSGNLMNMSPHPEADEEGWSPLDRIYVPRLLNSVAVDNYVLMRRANPELMALDTDESAALFAANFDLEDLRTEERILLIQHNLVAQRRQVEALAALPAGQRISTLRALVELATETYRALPPARIAGDGGGFLGAWNDALA
ncbi:serine/threonine-protein kinase [uncultured Microbacterium sp.]|uniref:serine/threonine-protein kinase n=1 Tax=uncultured Microbacterium sp. TaxID=191216 RepID=UPI0028DD3C67|nr:serine/threonine-protein kinase [uncultured Microbacterium sp.]